MSQAVIGQKVGYDLERFPVIESIKQNGHLFGLREVAREPTYSQGKNKYSAERRQARIQTQDIHARQ